MTNFQFFQIKTIVKQNQLTAFIFFLPQKTNTYILILVLNFWSLMRKISNFYNNNKKKKESCKISVLSPKMGRKL